MDRVKDPIVQNIEQAVDTLKEEIDSFSQEAEDLREFGHQLPVILSDPSMSVVDGFDNYFYSRHGDLYEEDEPLEALEEELENEFDFLKERKKESPRKARKIGASLNDSIDSRADTVEVLEKERKVLKAIHFQVDQDFRENGERPDCKVRLLKEGKLHRFNQNVFENELGIDPAQVDISAAIGKMKSSEDHLAMLNRSFAKFLSNNDTEYRDWLYRNQNFTNPVLEGVGLSLKAVRQEREKIEEFKREGTEHDYLIEVWSDYLQTEIDETPWSMIGTEIDYLGTFWGEDGNYNREFDVLIENQEDGDLVYLEVKPGSGGNKKARTQIERADEFDQICLLMGDGGRKYMGGVDVTGYIVDDLPDYTTNPIALIEESENKSVIT